MPSGRHPLLIDFANLTVTRGDKAVLRNVKTGPVSGDDTAIVNGGVKPGERVITDGADKVDNGSPLRVVSH